MEVRNGTVVFVCVGVKSRLFNQRTDECNLKAVGYDARVKGFIDD